MSDNTRPTDDEMPVDPMNVVQQDAVAAHELYESYVAAGFTESQAMELVKQITTTLLQAKMAMLMAQGINPFALGE